MTNTLVEKLLKDNFDKNQVLWNDNHFHTHVAHHLGSLSLLGASDEQIKDIYEHTMISYADKYQPSPHDITQDNWRASLGDKKFCSAYQNFFDQELPKQGDWKNKFFELFLDNTKGLTLIDAVFCGLFHPLIHMDYAIELNNRSVACEALTLAAVCLDPLSNVIAKLKPPTNGRKGALQIIKDIRTDDDAPIFDKPAQMESALACESLLLSHYNDWKVPDSIDKIVEELFDLAVCLFGGTHKSDQIDFDFVLLHLVTGMYAIKKIRSYLDENTIRRLLHGFFYLSLAIYISQKQPQINERLIYDYEIPEKKYNWEYVIDRTLNTKLSTEVHLVKVIRALKDADRDYGSKEGLYLKTAIKCVDNLHTEKPWNYYQSTEPWIGTDNIERQLNVKH